ncbi:SH3 domain-containing protein [Coralliovum pocilloporae]|uniref:SH3 domain-containing protein n=1 Tax=Coralliovum pocilloporae TaxID=3066369 RepID=UPI003307BA2F
MVRSLYQASLGVFVLLAGLFLADHTYAQQTKVGPSGLPLPRYVSIKSGAANVRIGPSRDHQVSWVFTRPGWPVEVIQEFDNWRRIRDADGAEGWVFHSLLSGARTALVVPWEKDTYQEALRSDAKDDASIVAWMEPKVLVHISECTGKWCYISVQTYDGWIRQDRLWGVYQDEQVN